MFYPQTSDLLALAQLSKSFLTTVIKLFDRCAKAFRHLSKKLKGRIIYIHSLNNPQLNTPTLDLLAYFLDSLVMLRIDSHFR